MNNEDLRIAVIQLRYTTSTLLEVIEEPQKLHWQTDKDVVANAKAILERTARTVRA